MGIRKEETDDKTQDIIQNSSITLDNNDSKGGDDVQTKSHNLLPHLTSKISNHGNIWDQGVKNAVRSCNSILASLEFAKHESTTSLVSTVHPDSEKGSTVLS